MRYTAPAVRLIGLTLALSALVSCDSSEPPDPIQKMVAEISTDLDPAYDYAYEQSRFVPPPGKTLLIMGQTLEAIDALTTSYPDQPLPGGWAAYWGIPSTEGLATPMVTEFGDTHHHQVLADRFPNAVLQSALWMVGTWDVAKRTADGEFDSVIREFSAWAKALDRPMYLRIGYEFDGPHNALEPTDYVRAYRRFVDITREEELDNVAFVWHSYGSPTFNGHPLSAWYPGDSYVDWVGISLFGHLYGSGIGAEGDAVFNFARVHGKPVMVAETSPVQGISPNDAEVWSDWFVKLFSLGYSRNIKAISFINSDWTRFPPVASQGWRDARLQNNEQVADAFFAEIAKGRYQKASPELFGQLGFPE